MSDKNKTINVPRKYGASRYFVIDDPYTEDGEDRTELTEDWFRAFAQRLAEDGVEPVIILAKTHSDDVSATP